jgi:hypothetical protein
MDWRRAPMSSQFLNADHKRRYMVALGRLDPAFIPDGEWQSMIFLMTVSDATTAALMANTDWRWRTIRWTKIMEKPFSSGETFIAELANQLYNNDGKPDLSSLWFTLSSEWFEVVIQALYIRRWGLAGFTSETLADLAWKEGAPFG